MFENLSEKLERSFKILKGQGKITEINVAETLKDVRRALLDADVSRKNIHRHRKAEGSRSECNQRHQTSGVDGKDRSRRAGYSYGRGYGSD